MPPETRLPGGDPADQAFAGQTFDRVMAELGAEPRRAAVIREGLESRYRERGRHYHTLDHVAAMTGLAANHRAEIHDLSTVNLAIWYHDAIYRPRRTDNEARSAALARHQIGSTISAGMVATIEQLILSTGTHQPVAGPPDSALFLDFDLAILGSEPSVYDDYARAIRAEYCWVPTTIYREKRAEVLARFATRPTIYSTGGFIPWLERSAQNNLSRELAGLRGEAGDIPEPFWLRPR